MPIKIREMDEKTGKPKQKMPLPKPKPRHANPKHPMNTERTGPLRKAGGGSMKIKSGDTLSQIAKKNNISLRDLLSANPSIENANQIRVGQNIKLPSTKMTGSSIGATRNPYKNMSKTDMADMDVKNKSEKRQQDVTKRSRVSALDELKAKAKAPKALPKLGKTNPTKMETTKQNSKKAANTQVEVSKGTPAMNKAASLKNVTSQKNRDLDDYRERMRRRADRRMGGGKMKKVSGYKSGGMVRGAGAATKGKRFGRCG